MICSKSFLPFILKWHVHGHTAYLCDKLPAALRVGYLNEEVRLMPVLLWIRSRWTSTVLYASLSLCTKYAMRGKVDVLGT